MRRADREVTDAGAIFEILTGCKVCRVAFNTGGAPYIVPLSAGALRSETGLPTIFFHCAGQGRKLDLLAADARVGFEADGEWALTEAEKACGYGCRFASVIGTGRMQIVQVEQEKRAALDVIMRQQTGRDGFEYDDASVRAVTILRLDVEEISGKRC